MVNTASARAYHRKELLPGETRGISGLRTQLPSQQLAEVAALQPDVRLGCPSSCPSPQGDVCIPTCPFSVPTDLGKHLGSLRICSQPADTPWPQQR